MHGNAGDAATPAASCRNVRRGKVMTLPPQFCAASRLNRTRLATDYTSCRQVEGPTASAGAGLTCGETPQGRSAPCRLIKSTGAQSLFVNGHGTHKGHRTV